MSFNLYICGIWNYNNSLSFLGLSFFFFFNVIESHFFSYWWIIQQALSVGTEEVWQRWLEKHLRGSQFGAYSTLYQMQSMHHQWNQCFDWRSNFSKFLRRLRDPRTLLYGGWNLTIHAIYNSLCEYIDEDSELLP